MIRFAESIFLIICCFFIAVFIPNKVYEERDSITEESFHEKQLTDLAYKIYTEKRIDLGDFYNLGVQIEAFGDDSYISFEEIAKVVEDQGAYYFTEAYVRITYKNEVQCLRIN